MIPDIALKILERYKNRWIGQYLGVKTTS
jgi:hypothetical protein